MLHKFLTLAADEAADHDLRHSVADFIKSLLASAGRGDRGQVAQIEAIVGSDPKRVFSFDPVSSLATLTPGEQTWQVGRFETPSIANLQERVRKEQPPSAGGVEARLWVLDGASLATDIGSLQATACPGSLFQVASQFNCLEATGPHVAPVATYFHDSTQGPRASISAFPGTFLRHYCAPNPGGERFVQETNGRQIDLLADVFEPEQSPVCNGYLRNHGGMGARALIANLDANFERIRVGLHDQTQVVLGYNWDGAVETTTGPRLISQVFTSTVAGGGYGGEASLGKEFKPACRLLLRAAYLGTLLAAVALGRSTVVLTLIGGGVFGNPIELIWEAILGAFDAVRPLAGGRLDVVLNGYNLSGLIDLERILPDVRCRGGAILRFDRFSLTEIRR